MKSIAFALAGLAITAATPALAKDVVVQMKNQGAGGAMVFEPAFVKANVGDTVRFVPTDMSHNAETIPTMLPAGVAPSVGGMNKEFVLTVTKPGLYGIKCKPHFSMGMVALVQVGAGPSPNLAAARAVKLPPFAAKRMTPLLGMAK
ncbi:pseudoazurin [Sphingomonas donggukensis]|uniref:Pseudoazurin n=1 Tax=Sphingomonas donggukensis TaxID=2949093 RepID=A0ABY4TVH8_9SPHN|nr:pseudoazurin [Sphingomonas donggukensis]URW76338.1 pseudoazurin [Sphingomonas donggukensis]